MLEPTLNAGRPGEVLIEPIIGGSKIASESNVKGPPNPCYTKAKGIFKINLQSKLTAL